MYFGGAARGKKEMTSSNSISKKGKRGKNKCRPPGRGGKRRSVGARLIERRKGKKTGKLQNGDIAEREGNVKNLNTTEEGGKEKKKT